MRSTVVVVVFLSVLAISGFDTSTGDSLRVGIGGADNPTIAAATGFDAPGSIEWQPRASRQSTYDPDQSVGHVVSHLRIPAIGVDEIIRAGMDLDVIDQGPAHWVGTASPGDQGNVVLAGHRTTHTRPFHDLDRLAARDLIYVTDAAGFEVMYAVTEIFIVEPNEIWITYENGEPLLTLFACHPKGSAAQRIVVRAEMVSGRRIA